MQNEPSHPYAARWHHPAEPSWLLPSELTWLCLNSAWLVNSPNRQHTYPGRSQGDMEGGGGDGEEGFVVVVGNGAWGRTNDGTDLSRSFFLS